MMSVEIKGLSYRINDKEILRDIGLKICKGEFVGLIGPNGAGKTTLLKCINNINKGEGEIRLHGVSSKGMTEKEVAKKVALMSQNSFISFPFPALDIVMMGRYPHMRRLKGETKEDYDIAKRNMEYTDTLKFERTPISQMSGGESQRVLFAKVLTQETDIILLDEPTASLDISHQEQIFRRARELSAGGKTVIAAIHDLKIASRYCSTLVLLKHGRIVAAGRPEEVLTSQNLSAAYGVNALVYKNRVTGLLDFHIHESGQRKKGHKVHVIGGGGTASGIIRQLFDNGFSITAGVFAHGDSDLQCAEVFGIEYLAGEPFSNISGELHEANIDMVRKAEFTVLCNMPFGNQNIRNLEAAGFADKLVIIEDDDPVTRDFTGAIAISIYNGLREKAIVTTSARLHEVLQYD